MDWQEQEAEKNRRHKEWLKSLKVGDIVAIPNHSLYYGPSYNTHKIVRETPTQFVCGGSGDSQEFRVRKEDGRVVGESFGYVEEYTEKVKAAIRRQSLIQSVQNLLYQTKIDHRSMCDKLPDNLLEKIKVILIEVQVYQAEQEVKE